ncbi:MAG: hypothetical protein HUU54_16075 [Ignavibacteriaceae bacterium]|nr:hypothetical protein [Ignavibacteriaceae bacterium]
MSKLREKFTKKEWSKCCTSLCDDCLIAGKYRKKYGKKEGRAKMKKDKKKVMD